MTTNPAAIVAALPPELVQALLVLAPVIDEIRRQRAQPARPTRARRRPVVALPEGVTAETVERVKAELRHRVGLG